MTPTDEVINRVDLKAGKMSPVLETVKTHCN